jgi:hypothetical protein
MSNATINPTTTSRTATNVTTTLQAATNGGDFFATTGVELLAIQNGGGADITLTITPQQTIDGQSVAAKTYTIAHTSAPLYIIGPFSRTTYGDASGNVVITYSGVSSLNVAVIKPGGS